MPVLTVPVLACAHHVLTVHSPCLHSPCLGPRPHLGRACSVMEGSEQLPNIPMKSCMPRMEKTSWKAMHTCSVVKE